MASVHDVAKYILEKMGATSAMKLQKLLYYCQAWSLVWDDKPLFQAKIQAWANGPVIPSVYFQHRGKFKVNEWPMGDIDNLTEDQIETIDGVLKFYGNRTAQWLSDLTHQERPWVDARRGLPDGKRGEKEITHAALHEYYSSL